MSTCNQTSSTIEEDLKISLEDIFVFIKRWSIFALIVTSVFIVFAVVKDFYKPVYKTSVYIETSDDSIDSLKDESKVNSSIALLFGKRIFAKLFTDNLLIELTKLDKSSPNNEISVKQAKESIFSKKLIGANKEKNADAYDTKKFIDQLNYTLSKKIRSGEAPSDTDTFYVRYASSSHWNIVLRTNRYGENGPIKPLLMAIIPAFNSTIESFNQQEDLKNEEMRKSRLKKMLNIFKETESYFESFFPSYSEDLQRLKSEITRLEISLSGKGQDSKLTHSLNFKNLELSTIGFPYLSPNSGFIEMLEIENLTRSLSLAVEQNVITKEKATEYSRSLEKLNREWSQIFSKKDSFDKFFVALREGLKTEFTSLSPVNRADFALPKMNHQEDLSTSLDNISKESFEKRESKLNLYIFVAIFAGIFFSFTFGLIFDFIRCLKTKRVDYISKFAKR